MHKRTHLLLAAILLSAPAILRAIDEIPAGNLLYAVGTTYTAEGQSHGYLLWMPTDEDLLRFRAYSIWSKPGGPDSPALYEPESIVRIQTEPPVIEAILRRAERLGQDLSALETAIDSLFEMISPGDAMSRSEKLSVVIQGASLDAEMYHNLLVLARLHPAVGLCIGAAWTGPIDGLRTYEIRMCPDAAIPLDPGDCTRVVGRVTLDPAAYSPLPAPGRPVPVPFGRIVNGELVPDVRSDLNIRLRWSTPVALRRLALLQFGYEIYRVETDFFHSMGLDDGLEPGEARLLAEAFPEKVRKANRYPVLIERFLDEAEAADVLGDIDTFFFIDDNDRFDPGGVPFNDGDAFFYLVTTIDIIGREGHYSEPAFVQLCRRMPPNAPRGVTVRDKVSYPTPTTERQDFGLAWRIGQPVADSPVERFDIYRWEEPDTHISATFEELDEAYRGNILAKAGKEYYEYEDLRGDAVLERAYWFTVQAVMINGCGEQVLSPHSPPVSGVLRDRSGPGEVGQIQPVVRINKSRPSFDILGVSAQTLEEEDPGYVNLRLSVTRGPDDLPVDAADFYYAFEGLMQPLAEAEDTPIGPVPPGYIYLGSIRFRNPEDQSRSLDYRFRLQGTPNQYPLKVFFRARSRHGVRSGFAERVIDTSANNIRHIIHARARHEYVLETPDPDNLQHVAQTTLDGMRRPSLEFNLIVGVHTWKLYRRIDSGPMSLVGQGSAIDEHGDPITQKIIEQDLVLMNAGRVCYFLQMINESGYADPLIELDCFDTTPVEPPMAPMLLPVEPLTGRQAQLTWACPPHGVSHFHIAVATPGGLPPERISPDLGPSFETRLDVAAVIDGETVSQDFRVYSTSFISASAGPEHSVVIDVEESKDYLFFVEAVPAMGETSAPGNTVRFTWTDPRDGGPDAVWPVRPLPDLRDSRFPTRQVTSSGIVIGRLPSNVSVQRVDNRTVITPDVDPNDYLFAEELGIPEGGTRRVFGRTILPCVVYRYQVPNTRFPLVSGDVYQVTPMLRAIASRSEEIDGQLRHVVYDPWFLIDTRPAGRYIYIRENHPVLHEASYRYIVVLFRENGEIEAVFPTDTFNYIIN